MGRPLLLVDSASLYFRAFFGIPESAARAPDGRPVNAVRGFLDMVATLIRTRRPDRVVCALDEDWRPAWRVALIPSYKTHRLAVAGGDLNPGGGFNPSPDIEIVPEALEAQVPIILDVLAAFGIATAGAAEYEADDVIGTLATREPGPIEVATGDRDLFQVVDDDRDVRVLYCGRGLAKLEVLDDAAIHAKYGVAAAGYADFAAMRGDPSDGLPGVPGVGEKTAARLLDRYGSLDGILAALDDPSAGFAPGLRTKLQAAKEYLAVAPTVVRVAREIKLPRLDTALPAAPRSPERVSELAQAWNVSGAVRRLTEALTAAAA
jgi:5'-3' exonuclease